MAGKTDENIEETRNSHLRPAFRMKVGATSSDDLERIIHEGRLRGQIYGKLKSRRQQLRRFNSPALPQYPPPQFPATT